MVQNRAAQGITFGAFCKSAAQNALCCPSLPGSSVRAMSPLSATCAHAHLRADVRGEGVLGPRKLRKRDGHDAQERRRRRRWLPVPANENRRRKKAIFRNKAENRVHGYARGASRILCNDIAQHLWKGSATHLLRRERVLPCCLLWAEVWGVIRMEGGGCAGEHPAFLLPLEKPVYPFCSASWVSRDLFVFEALISQVLMLKGGQLLHLARSHR